MLIPGICQIHDSCVPRRETIERPSDSGAMVECCPTRDQSRLLQCGKKVPFGMLSGCAQTDRGGVNLERRNFGHMH